MTHELSGPVPHVLTFICHASLLITGIRGGGCKAMFSLLPGDILIAADRIKPYTRKTPLEYSYWLRIYVKLDE